MFFLEDLFEDFLVDLSIDDVCADDFTIEDTKTALKEFRNVSPSNQKSVIEANAKSYFLKSLRVLVSYARQTLTKSQFGAFKLECIDVWELFCNGDYELIALAMDRLERSVERMIRKFNKALEKEDQLYSVPDSRICKEVDSVMLFLMFIAVKYRKDHVNYLYDQDDYEAHDAYLRALVSRVQNDDDNDGGGTAPPGAAATGRVRRRNELGL
jgi:hypothetical protein